MTLCCFWMTTVRTTILARETMGTSIVLPHLRPSEAATHLPLLLPSAIAATTSYGGRRMSGAEIPGDQLRFNWAWIAAAHQVIELNLRDLLTRRHQGVLRALLSLDGLRPCSSPGFPPVTAEVVAGEPVFKDGEGWDWAGRDKQK
ncbi:hypothetical protein F5148DRAFT_185706 [Russula earlei]|uniref:Uncharacterized protein n=1 Tax=Russula earlei TaxID=71964 RepID=A0ACC0U6H7_9AGAM|nr:hypothetical protein F5148DRAFT_185706 [Russula earlei]